MLGLVHQFRMLCFAITRLGGAYILYVCGPRRQLAPRAHMRSTQIGISLKMDSAIDIMLLVCCLENQEGLCWELGELRLYSIVSLLQL